jgi:hypothetical protein
VRLVRLSFKLNLAGVGLSVLDGALQEVLYASASGVRCSVYLLYWYKSTCFTGTKVQILTGRRVVSGRSTYADVC